MARQSHPVTLALTTLSAMCALFLGSLTALIDAPGAHAASAPVSPRSIRTTASRAPHAHAHRALTHRMHRFGLVLSAPFAPLGRMRASSGHGGAALARRSGPPAGIAARTDDTPLDGATPPASDMTPTPIPTPMPVPASLAPSVDLSRYDPPVGNQDALHSCTSWAIGYYLRGWYARRDGYYPGGDAATGGFAPMYLYSQVARSGDGSSFTDNLNILRTQGIAPRIDYAQGDDNGVDRPTPAEQQTAAPYRISGYSYLLPRTGPLQQQIEGSIAGGDPVVLAVPVYSNFDAADATHYLIDGTPGALEGYHAVFASHYDEQGVWVLNQWGTDWGHDGYAELSWAFVNGHVPGGVAMRPAAAIPATNTPTSVATATSTSIPPTAQPSAATQADNATPATEGSTGTPTTTSPPGARVTTPTATTIATIAAPTGGRAGQQRRHSRHGRGRGGLVQPCRPQVGADCADVAGYTLRAAAEARRYPGLAYTSIAAQWTVPAAPPAVPANGDAYNAAGAFVGLGRRGVGVIRAGVSAEWRDGKPRYAFFTQYDDPNGTGSEPLALPNGLAVGRGQAVSVRLTYRGRGVVDVLIANRTTGQSHHYSRIVMPAADYARGAEAYVSFEAPYNYRPLSAPLRFARVRVVGAYHGGVVTDGLVGLVRLRDRMVDRGDTVVAEPGVVDTRTDGFTVYNAAVSAR